MKYLVVSHDMTRGGSFGFDDIAAAREFARAEREKIGGWVEIYLSVEEALRRGQSITEHDRSLTLDEQKREHDAECFEDVRVSGGIAEAP